MILLAFRTAGRAVRHQCMGVRGSPVRMFVVALADGCLPSADLHNETGVMSEHLVSSNCSQNSVNIHSHLMGAVLFAWLLGSFRQVYFVHYDQTTWIDTTVFAIFLSCAMMCLFFSAFYHTCSAHSAEVSGYHSVVAFPNMRWLLQLQGVRAVQCLGL